MEISGEVKNVIFRSEDTGYTVLDVTTEDGATYTAVGIFSPVSEGENVRLDGAFQTKSAYGKQFLCEKVYVAPPSRLEGIKRFLASGLIKGLGPVTAEAIVDTFGVRSLDVMQRPLELAKVRGVSLRKATEFGMNYIKLQKMQDAVMFLQELGITINLALKIYARYEDKTVENVKHNPYMLVDDIDGVGFATADRIGAAEGIKSDSDYRIEAAIAHVLKSAASKNGNAFLYEPDLMNEVLGLLRLECDEPDVRVRDNVSDMVMLGLLVRYDTGNGVAIMHRMNYNVERNIAKRLAEIKDFSADLRVKADDAIARCETEAGITLHPHQREAVKAAIESGVHIITGGPGTGKTTIVKCVLSLFKNLGLAVALCAPTGRAAKRLAAATATSASTIHRLLGLNVVEGSVKYTYCASKKLEQDVIIVDEVSMVDEYVFEALLNALKTGARIVLVGDKDQLPSVGVGCVLSDLIESKMFSVSMLTQIYRQSEDSKIVVNAHRINNGEMPDTDNKSNDFFFNERTSSAEIAATTVELVTKRLPSFLKMDAKDIQVLCPMKRGTAGIIALNNELQRRINPYAIGKKELRRQDFVFREGDKVMQTANDYQQTWSLMGKDGLVNERGTGVFNGDIGYIESINTQIMQFTIRFDDDKVAVYQFDAISNLTLAYAVTIHKSQGSEFDAVVIALDANYMLQTRNLIYTAVTRAKKLVVIVGAKETLQRMIRNNETQRRNSLLPTLIKEQFAPTV